MAENITREDGGFSMAKPRPPATARRALSRGRERTLDEVAAALQLRPADVLEYVRRGELTGRKVGRSWRFTQEDIDAFLAPVPLWDIGLGPEE